MNRVLGGRWFGGAMMGATFWLLSACQGESSREGEDGDDEDTPSGFCGRLLSNLGGCGMGVLWEEFDTCREPEEDEDRCTANCIVNLSCDELRSVFCLNSLSPGLEACLDACEPPLFICGDGYEVPDSWVCDGFPDCSDGSDEQANCPMCDNGVTVPEFVMCDGFRDCADGRDELGCPTFTCRSGETLPEFVECDAYLDCADGSDEHAECPDIFSCGNGDFIPIAWECDGEADCLDGSDEHGACPSVACADGTTMPGERCDGYADCFDASDEPANCPPTPLEEACGTG